MSTPIKSELFTTKNRKKIENAVIDLLNGNQLMNKNTVNSPRRLVMLFRVFWKTILRNVSLKS